MTKYLLVLGASSDIAKEISKQYAREGYSLYLTGRNLEELKKDANNISIRFGVKVKVIAFDALKYNSHQEFYNSLLPKPYGTICAFGYLGDQEKAESDFIEAKNIIDTNFTACVSILNIISNDFEKRKHGFIIGLSSVAGDRGRGSNYIYGSCKAALTTYLSGLRNRLSKFNVQVITVKPGFVATKMTHGMKFSPLLITQVEDVAKDVLNAHKKKKDIIYTKWFWKIIMFVISIIPETFFKRMKV